MNKCVRFSLLLLIYFKLARFEINTSETRPSLICEASDLSPSEFDCSNNKLNWLDLKNLIDSTFSATILNLSRNKFNSNIPNLAFNNFKTLNETLNLSSNGLETIEPMAFYFDKKMSRNENEPIQFDTLKIINLDLSSNSFKTIPWNSIRSLKHLQHLYLNSNQITSLDLGDLSINDHDHNNILSSIKYLYLKSNKITYIDFKILKYLVNLNLLDLSSNSLKSIDFMIGQILSFNNEQRITNEYTKLEVKNNPLVCDCNLLWFKKYIKNYYNDIDAKDQMCTLRHPIESSTTSLQSLYKIETINLDSRDKPINVYRDTDFVYSDKNDQRESIANLDDSKYLCEIEFIDSLSTTNITKLDNYNYKIELKCVVTGYPKPVIRWNKGNKAIIKNFNKDHLILDEERSSLNNKVDKTTYVNDMYTITSKLIIQKITDSENDFDEYKNYSCRAKYDLNTLVDNQKIILFQIFNSNQMPQNIEAKAIIDNRKTESKETNIGLYGNRSEKYWIVLLLSILVALVFILFASICIIKNIIQSYKLEKKIIAKEKAFNMNRNSTYSTNHMPISSMSRRHHEAYYSGSTTTTASTTRNSAIGLLKPDIIRPHQDSSCGYSNNTRTVSTTRQSSPNSNSNNYFYTSPISMIPKYTDMAELDNLIARHNPYDNQPAVESSSFLYDYEANLSTSSKSFDENIEQYQEPQFDDLSKPVLKQKNEQVTNQ